MAGTQRTGPAEADDEVSVTIVVRRRPDGPPLPGIDAFTSLEAGRRHRRSGPDFAARYGALPRDLAAVEEFAASYGLRVTRSRSARRAVNVAGSVRQMNAAFGVDLGRYESPEVTYRGREGLIYVPARLRNVITGVFGLDSRPVGGHNVCNPRPPVTFGFTPPKVAALYGFPRASAKDHTIGILSFGGGYRPDDISAFYDTLGPGFTMPVIRDVPAGAPNTPGAFGPIPGGDTADAENIGDICVASSVAQGADIAVYFAPFTQQGWVDALAMAIHPDPGEPAPTVLSVSWYISRGDDSATMAASGVADSWVDAVNACLHDAAIVGITVVAASGDYGSTAPVTHPSGPPTISDVNAHVQYPASDPFVLSVGGTAISNADLSHPTASFTETAWNESTTNNPGATGGGISARFDPPAWQNAAGVPASASDPARRGRGVPDVAGNSASASGYQIFYSCLPVPGGFSGTSAAAPLYAGLIAMINASLLEPVGYLNPTLYQLALHQPSVFKDIRDGNNACSYADDAGNVVTPPSYTSGPGWDACTGLGVINGGQLLTAIHQELGHSVLRESSSEGPALASHDGFLFLAWKGSDNDQLNIAVINPGEDTVNTELVVPQTTKHAPALVSHDGQLFLGWTGEGDELLNLAAVTTQQTPQGLVISVAPPQVLGDSSSEGPALASHGGRLFLAWKGADNAQVNVALVNPGGAGLASSLVVPQTTEHSPALASDGTRLLLAWSGQGGEHLNLATVTAGQAPSGSTIAVAPPQVLGDSSGEAPALAAQDGMLFLAWKGSGNDQLNVARVNPGETGISGKQVLPQTTTHAPGLVSHLGQLLLGWAGQGDENLNIEKLTVPVFAEAPLDRARALMAFAQTLLTVAEEENLTGGDAVHDLRTAADALRGFSPPPEVLVPYQLLLLAVLRALATALIVDHDFVDAIPVIWEALGLAHLIVSLPGGSPLLVIGDANWLASALVTAGQPAEAVTAQQALVDMLTGFTPNGADQPDYVISLAETRHDLIARLIDNHQTADAAPLADPTLGGYQQYATLAPGDFPRLAQDLSALGKQLWGAGLVSQALATAQAAVTALQAITPVSEMVPEYQITFAEALQNLITRLIDTQQPAAATPWIAPAIADYRAYIAGPHVDWHRVQADLVSVIPTLQGAGFTAEGAQAQQLLDQVSASAATPVP